MIRIHRARSASGGSENHQFFMILIFSSSISFIDLYLIGCFLFIRRLKANIPSCNAARHNHRYDTSDPQLEYRLAII